MASKEGGDYVNKILALSVLPSLFLLVFGCSPTERVGPDPNLPPPHVQEIEPNNSLITAQFVGLFTAPDFVHIDGGFSILSDFDYYKLYSPYPQLTSIVINTSNGVIMEATLITKDIEHPDIMVIGHWIGDPGHLEVLQWPTYSGNEGIYLILNSPTGILGAYNVEMWAQ
mgnify:CR=1 FL=1